MLLSFFWKILRKVYSQKSQQGTFWILVPETDSDKACHVSCDDAIFFSKFKSSRCYFPCPVRASLRLPMFMQSSRLRKHTPTFWHHSLHQVSSWAEHFSAVAILLNKWEPHSGRSCKAKREVQTKYISTTASGNSWITCTQTKPWLVQQACPVPRHVFWLRRISIASHHCSTRSTKNILATTIIIL